MILDVVEDQPDGVEARIVDAEGGGEGLHREVGQRQPAPMTIGRGDERPRVGGHDDEEERGADECRPEHLDLARTKSPSQQVGLPLHQRHRQKEQVLETARPAGETLHRRSLEDLQHPEALSADVNEVEDSQAGEEVEREHGIDVVEVQRGVHRHPEENEQRNAEVDDPVARRTREVVEVGRLQVQEQRDEEMRPTEADDDGQEKVRNELDEVRDQTEHGEREEYAEKRSEDDGDRSFLCEEIHQRALELPHPIAGRCGGGFGGCRSRVRCRRRARWRGDYNRDRVIERDVGVEAGPGDERS